MDQLLNVFVTVVEENSFTKAAEKLHMTQPAVSQTIKTIEARLGVQLLERQHKQFHMNQAGEIVYQYAKEILNTYHKMTELVQELEHEPKGALRIGVSYTIGEYFLPAVLSQLVSSYPDIHPHVTIHNTDEVKSDILENKIDIALVEGEVDHPDIDVKAFATDEMCILASAKHFPEAQNSLTVQALENFNWLIREEGSGTRAQTQKFLHDYQLEPLKIFTLGSTQIIKEAVEAGLGVTILSQLVIQKELALNKLQKLAIQHPPLKRQFYRLKRKENFEAKKLRAFEEIVWQTAEKLL